jgi:hypothetical protein
LLTQALNHVRLKKEGLFAVAFSRGMLIQVEIAHRLFDWTVFGFL